MFSIDHDYHIHTNLSACSHDPLMTPQNLLPIVQEEGLREVVITNHFWDSRMPGADEWYGPQDLAHVRKAFPLPQRPGIKMRFGCETEYCGGEKIGISPESYDAFDFIIVPFNHLHNHFSRPADCVTPLQVAELYMKHFQELLTLPLPWRKVGVAHLTCPLTYPGEKLYQVFEALDGNRLRKCFRMISAKGAGVELNAACFRPGWEKHEGVFLNIYRLAREEGCKFYLGSDAHSLTDLKRLKEYLPSVIHKLELSDGDRYAIAP